MTHNSFDDRDEDEKGGSFPETARSLFDPLVKTMNRENTKKMAEALSAVIRQRERQITKRIIRTDDL